MVAGGTIPTHRPGLPIRALRIEVVEGPDRGKVHLSDSDVVSIGTGPTNALVLMDQTVSGYHVDLSRKDSGVLVVDHGSTNGTFFAGARLHRAVVRPGALLKMGRTTIRVDDGATLEVEAHGSDRLAGILGRAPAMRRLMAQVARVAASDSSVLLHGETGTGKEVVARVIHELSKRAEGPLETVDCGAVLPNLMASELFGHEKGAFTGADQQHLGAFERADGGTLFLDEVGELPPNLQTALLGALERRSFRRVGGKKPISVDVRVVFATHRDLREEVNAGSFRQDLYYRIAVVVLEIPALRDRPEDIPLLLEHFARGSGYEGPMDGLFPAEALESLVRYRWPGNVRELRNVVESSLVMGEAPVLGGHARDSRIADGASLALDRILGRPYSEARELLLDAFERTYVEDVLKRADGNVSEAARLAEMNRSYLTRLLKRIRESGSR